MKTHVGTAMLKQAAGNNLAGLLNRFGVFSGGNPAHGLQKGWEVISQPIRDYQIYPAAGYLARSYFQAQAGSVGTTNEGNNMPGAGIFPRGQMFLAEGFEVDFKPSQLPSALGAPAVDAIANDVWNVYRAGYLTLTISTRPYLNVGPLSQFPPSFRVTNASALSDSTTAGAAQARGVVMPFAQGEPFSVIPFMLEEAVNFEAVIKFDAPVPVAADSHLGIIMNGALIRRNQ